MTFTLIYVLINSSNWPCIVSRVSLLGFSVPWSINGTVSGISRHLSIFEFIDCMNGFRSLTIAFETASFKGSTSTSLFKDLLMRAIDSSTAASTLAWTKVLSVE